MRRKSLKPFGLSQWKESRDRKIHWKVCQFTRVFTLYVQKLTGLADGFIYALQLQKYCLHTPPTHTHRHTGTQVSPQVALLTAGVSVPPSVLYLAALAWQAVRAKVFYDDNVGNYEAAASATDSVTLVVCKLLPATVIGCQAEEERRKLTKYAQVELLLCILFAVNGKYTMPHHCSPSPSSLIPLPRPQLWSVRVRPLIRQMCQCAIKF